MPGCGMKISDESIETSDGQTRSIRAIGHRNGGRRRLLGSHDVAVFGVQEMKLTFSIDCRNTCSVRAECSCKNLLKRYEFRPEFRAGDAIAERNLSPAEARNA